MSSDFLIAKKKFSIFGTSQHQEIARYDCLFRYYMLCGISGCFPYKKWLENFSDFNPLSHQICVQFRQGTSPQYQYCYLDLVIWYGQLNQLFSNSEAVMLSSLVFRPMDNFLEGENEWEAMTDYSPMIIRSKENWRQFCLSISVQPQHSLSPDFLFLSV